MENTALILTELESAYRRKLEKLKRPMTGLEKAIALTRGEFTLYTGAIEDAREKGGDGPDLEWTSVIRFNAERGRGQKLEQLTLEYNRLRAAVLFDEAAPADVRAFLAQGL